MTLSIMTFSILKFRITTLSIIIFKVTTLNIMILCFMALSVRILSNSIKIIKMTRGKMILCMTKLRITALSIWTLS
jgi:hypothetical protein